MRTFIVAILLIVLVLGGLVTYANLLFDTRDAMLQKTEILRLAAQNADWQRAADAAHALKDDWQKTAKKLALLVEHIELDEIMLATARATAYAENREGPELLAEVYSLEELFEHIAAKEALTIYNIF